MSATNRGAARRTQDRYQTPLSAIEPLLEYIDWPRARAWGEPCRGKGNIQHAVDAKAPFLCAYRYCEIDEGLDYLQSDWHDLNLIITNPPFSLAMEFLTRSLSQAKTVIYLLRLNFLGSQRRKKFWQAHPPSHLFVLSQRPSFRASGGTDATEYAWFAWDRGSLLTVPPGIYVL